MSHLSPFGGKNHDDLLAPSPTPTHTGEHHTSQPAVVRDPSKKHEPSASYLKDLNLVAEAARRAQNALLARDFENCSLDKR
ncbi:hypothetical protein DRE_04081 [Drechslerella stenobrocha 248]|uniref:Uncharacterized protein n=1 Tax=Drechslerella stenobrocha 248 TaxID=1043628 RepID=W7HTC3_9PEZI|nr:hypothetical protein DRE_04081 [Drechslerella stenobrocha 248]